MFFYRKCTLSQWWFSKHPSITLLMRYLEIEQNHSLVLPHITGSCRTMEARPLGTRISQQRPWCTLYSRVRRFFLVAPTQINIELFNQYTSQETNAVSRLDFNIAELHCIRCFRIPNKLMFCFDIGLPFFVCHKRLEGGCAVITVKPGDILVMPSQFLHFVLTNGNSVAVGSNFLAEGHSNSIRLSIENESSFPAHDKFPGLPELFAILLHRAAQSCKIVRDFCVMHRAIDSIYNEQELQMVSVVVPNKLSSIV